MLQYYYIILDINTAKITVSKLIICYTVTAILKTRTYEFTKKVILYYKCTQKTVLNARFGSSLESTAHLDPTVENRVREYI